MDAKLYVLVGHNKGQYFDLDYGKTYLIGRSPDSDIQIRDKHVSRYHLKIEKKKGKIFLKDLKSKNGTFANGKDLEPGVDVEVVMGSPIVIGMTLLCLGNTCSINLQPFLESIGINSEAFKNSEDLNPNRSMALKKDLGLIYNVMNILTVSKEKHEILESISDLIFNLLKRIDRCAIMLINEKTGEISDIARRSRKPVDDSEPFYNHQLVEKALMLNRAVSVSDSNDDWDEKDGSVNTLKLLGIGSAMCVPMSSISHTIGVIYVDSLEKAHGFRMSDLTLLKDIGSRVALAIDSMELYNL
jgi:pSer/pThr/pTyr-binding forkhead associated (FHA) protein